MIKTRGWPGAGKRGGPPEPCVWGTMNEAPRRGAGPEAPFLGQIALGQIALGQVSRGRAALEPAALERADHSCAPKLRDGPVRLQGGGPPRKPCCPA